MTKTIIMRKIFSFILLALLPACAVLAQSYDKLWGEVRAASEKDLPKTALAKVNQIYEKARREQNDGQLMRSLLVARQFHQEVAPDSGEVALRRLEAALAEKRRPVEKAMWQSALGQLMAASADTAKASRGRALLLASVSLADSLAAASAADYLPVLVRGKDSRLYADDLLSVLLPPVVQERRLPLEERRAALGRAADAYRRLGQREAQLLTVLDSIDAGRYELPVDGEVRRKALLAVADRFADLGLNVETYIRLAESDDYTQPGTDIDSIQVVWARRGVELYGRHARAEVLRQLIARKEQPQLRFDAPSHTLRPGQEMRVALTGRNVKQAEVRFFRLDMKASDNRLFRGAAWRDARKWPMKKAGTLRHDFAQAPAYVSRTDTVAFKLDEKGVYLCELLADGRHLDHEIVYVSSLMPVMLQAGEGLTRIVLVDAQSGTPVSSGAVREYTTGNTAPFLSKIKEHTPDANGEIVIPNPETRRDRYYFAVAGNDEYSAGFHVNRGYRVSTAAPQPDARLQLFADRAIYRPGQKVLFGGVAYTRLGDDVRTDAGFETLVRLFDSNRQVIDSVRCVTDEFGTIGGEFSLPAVCLPGQFFLRAERGATLFFKVEEYKRPTFTVEIGAPTTAYALGDTLRLSGTVKTYTGLPVSGAEVRFNVERRALYYFDGDDYEPQTGTAVSDEEGHFTLPVFLAYDGVRRPVARNIFNRLHYSVSADVTAANGETASASRLISAATRPSWLESDWGGSLCKEHLDKVTVRHLGAAGQQLDGKVRYAVSRDGRSVASGEMTAGRSFAPGFLSALSSGEYEIAFHADGADTLRRRFLLFSEHDTRPAGREVFWHYVRPSAAADSVHVIIGSPRRDVTLFYDLFAGGKRLESRRVTFSDSLLHFDLAYRPEMGDGATASFAFVKDGELFSTTQEVIRPVPEKKLRLEWSTFRSQLTPGGQEEWRLRVLNADGSPAHASLMARLYDASLDALASAPWDFNLYLGRYVPAARRFAPYRQSASMTGSLPLRKFNVPYYEFTHWDATLLDGGRNFGGTVRLFKKESKYMMADAVTALSGQVPGVRIRGTGNFAAKDMKAEAEVEADAGAAENAADEALPAGSVRQNFAETAYFAPQLRTDERGEVTLSFVLPESLTSWNFTALAHNTAMDHGRLDTTVVARKDFMVQPALPRFVRRGDRAVVPVELRSLTATPLSGTLTLTLLDAQTEQTVATVRQAFNLPAGATQTLRLEFKADFTAPVLVCRVAGKAGNFSDGEEHYLPVLDSRVQVVRSVPFSLNGAGSATWQLDTLWTDRRLAADRRLTVELSSNPLWYAVAALPALADGSSESVTGWAERYYAVVMAERVAADNPEIRKMAGADNSSWADLLNRNPELRQTLLAETPWVAEARTEAERTAALARLFDPQAVAAHKYKALDNLRALQGADGSWSWYKGMPGNSYLTTDVAIMLARLGRMVDDRDAAGMTDRAVKYLEKTMAREVSDMKKAEKKNGARLAPSEAQLRYLYLRAVLGLQPDADARYLLDRAPLIARSGTMYCKALTAVALSAAGRDNEAATFVKSLMEHTVTSPDMGRYFDTDRAQWSWNSYRIPTQTAALEALAAVRPDARAEADEMRLWLMQSRRTQLWGTGRATADAVYALLMTGSDRDNGLRLASGTEASCILMKGKKPIHVPTPLIYIQPNAAGHVSRTYADEPALGATAVKVEKQDAGLAWGSVVASYTLPADAVRATSSGLGLTVRYEVRRDGQWQPLDGTLRVKPGDRLRQVFTLTADRDYDFVSLRAGRAACLTPADALSGFSRSSGLPAYRAVRDAATDLYFEQVRKGRHVLTEEYFVDRAGTYRCAPSRVECAYAPEFTAQTPGTVFEAD